MSKTENYVESTNDSTPKESLKTRLYGKFRMAISVPKSLYFCIRCLPFKEAIHIPVLVNWKTRLLALKKDAVSVGGNLKPFHVKIGFGGAEKVPARRPVICLESGTVHFNGTATLSDGISLTNTGELWIGDDFYCNQNCTIWCTNSIRIGNSCLLGWNVVMKDDDGHPIYHDGIIANEKNKEIIIGNHCWLCADTAVLKGTVLGNGSIAGYRALLNKEYKGENVIVAGCPAKIMKENVTWKRH